VLGDYRIRTSRKRVARHTYVGNNPTRWIDIFGLTPGDPFDTRGAAAQDALNFINPRSIAENQEYIGVIYQNPVTCKYYATQPVATGCKGAKKVGIGIPRGMIPVGDYHTHGDYADGRCKRTSASDDRNNSDNFSGPDLGDGRKQDRKHPGWMKYLGTPSGSFKQYSPGSAPAPLDPTK
jgi:hypothetical protein